MHSSVTSPRDPMEELEKERKELEAMRKKHMAELKNEKDIE